MTTRGAVLPGRIAWEFNPQPGPEVGCPAPLTSRRERGAILALEQSCRVPGNCVGRATHQNWVDVSNVSLLYTGNEHFARTSFAQSNRNPKRKTDPFEKPGARTVLLLWTTLYGLCQRCVRITFQSVYTMQQWSNSQSEAAFLRPATRQHPHIIETHSLSPNCTQNPRRTSHWLSITKKSESLG